MTNPARKTRRDYIDQTRIGRYESEHKLPHVRSGDNEIYQVINSIAEDKTITPSPATVPLLVNRKKTLLWRLLLPLPR